MGKPLNLEANRKWLLVPKDIRKKIESNVWCSNCGVVVKIDKYRVGLLTEGLILQGICSNCGSEVARVIEG